MNIQWNTDDTLTIDSPKRPKKLSGTRFAAVLGANRWSTPFQMWCEITKAQSMPFEDTKYTLAGKAIEPKQIQYMRDSYDMNLIDPHDIWGDDIMGKTWGNFFSHPVFGGMWDALEVGEEWDGTNNGLVGNTETVLEFKTTKRAEDWAEDIPEYYALQAALYAWLLNCDEVIMVVSFLEDKDYDHPEDFVPSVENTATFEFNLYERYPNFQEEYLMPALDWWNEYVETGNSPVYDEKLDAEYLKELRKNTLNPDTNIDELCKKFRKLSEQLDAINETIKPVSKELDAVKKQLKQYAQENIGDNKICEFESNGVNCNLTKSISIKPDEAAMKKDGIWDKYAKETESARFTVKISKEND